MRPARLVTGLLLAPSPFFLLLLGPSFNKGFVAAVELFPTIYAPIVSLGLPIILILEHRGDRSLRSYFIAASIAMALVWAAIFVLDPWLFSQTNGNPFHITMRSQFGIVLWVISTLFGCLIAWIFWSIAVRPSLIDPQRISARWRRN